MSLRRKVQLVEDERDQLDSRLHATVEKLQEASKVVDEYERLFNYLLYKLFDPCIILHLHY